MNETITSESHKVPIQYHDSTDLERVYDEILAVKFSMQEAIANYSNPAVFIVEMGRLLEVVSMVAVDLNSAIEAVMSDVNEWGAQAKNFEARLEDLKKVKS